MRILLANHTGAWSGAEVSLMRLVAGLREEHELAIACPDDGRLAAEVGGEPAGDYLNDIRMFTEVSASDSVSPKTVIANCASGEEIVGGGANIEGGTVPENIVLQDSHPDQSDPGDAFDSWVAVAVETDGDPGNWTLTSYALCAEG